MASDAMREELDVMHATEVDRIWRECKRMKMDHVYFAWRIEKRGWERFEASLTKLLPGTHYMDPPDGGDVSVLEQLRRMSEDAAKWRNRTPAPEVAGSSDRENAERPAYPEGDVVGPCVCGSWPGGKCLKCEWIPARSLKESP